MTALAGDQLRGEKSAHSLWRRLLVTLALVVFAQANYLTQTHVHQPAPSVSTAAPGQHGKVPDRDDPAHCPLCQEFLVAGAYIAPGGIVLPLPELTSFAVLEVTRALFFVTTASHNWYGRAPPAVQAIFQAS